EAGRLGVAGKGVLKGGLADLPGREDGPHLAGQREGRAAHRLAGGSRMTSSRPPAATGGLPRYQIKSRTAAHTCRADSSAVADGSTACLSRADTVPRNDTDAPAGVPSR